MYLDNGGSCKGICMALYVAVRVVGWVIERFVFGSCIHRPLSYNGRHFIYSFMLFLNRNDGKYFPYLKKFF